MSTVAKGTDCFHTPPGGAHCVFTNALPIPAHFFHKGSDPFTGMIHFDGHPIGEFTDPTGKKHKTGTTDTMVQRKQDVVIKGNSGSGTTEIELVRLSLRSLSPIEVHVGRHVQHWDVYVSVSPSKAFTGTMTITQTHEHGGYFSATFAGAPLFRFAARHGAERHLDMGKLEIPAEKQALAARLGVLEATEVPWQDGPPEGENLLALPGLTSNFMLARSGMLIGLGWSHPVYYNSRPPILEQ